RGLERLVPGALRVDRETVADLTEPDLVGVEHRATAPYRPAVAVDPDHVDVTRPIGDPLLEDARALVDHRVDHALDDLLLVDLAPLTPEPLRGLDDELLDLRIGRRRARAGLIEVIALAGLLAVAPGLAQRIGDLGARAARAANAPADIESGEIAHRERPHRETELDDRRIDLVRQRALEQQPLGFDRAPRQHAVADEAVAIADHDRHLADLAAERDRGRERLMRGRLAAHDLQQPHDVCRAEEMRAEHVLRALGRTRDRIDVERRGVGGE